MIVKNKLNKWFKVFKVVCFFCIKMELISEDDVALEKQRSAKFNEDELNLLNNLIKKYKHILLNKQTGKVTPKQREDAWRAITNEFNSDPACSFARKSHQLKNKWDYMKRSAKKDVAAYKKSHRQTGGGKGPPPLDDTTAILLDTVRESVEGVPSSFDSDRSISQSSTMILLDDDNYDIISSPVTFTLPEIEPFEEKSIKNHSEQPLKPNMLDKIEASSSTVKTELCKNNVQAKKRKLNMDEQRLAKSSPQFTRSKFVELAEKKIQLLSEKTDKNLEKTTLELEILQKKTENVTLERKKLELECSALSLDIEIKQLIKKKTEIEVALLEIQLKNSNNKGETDC